MIMKIETRLKKMEELKKKLNESNKKSLLNLRKIFENSTEDEMFEKFKINNTKTEK